MTSEQGLLDAWSKMEFTPEQVEAILERCADCGDGFLATVITKALIIDVVVNWDSIEDRVRILGEDAVGRPALHMSGRYIQECDPTWVPIESSIVRKTNMKRYRAAKDYIKEKINERRSRKD